MYIFVVTRTQFHRAEIAKHKTKNANQGKVTS